MKKVLITGANSYIGTSFENYVMQCHDYQIDTVDMIDGMLYIGNLTEFVKLMIDNNESGIFYPQNAEYVATSEMVQVIAQAHGKKTRLVKGTTVPLKAMSHVTGLVNKAFGNLSYFDFS